MYNAFAFWKHINLSYLDFTVAFILVALAVGAPRFLIPEVGNLVSAVSAVFAIVAGFFIADATGNYLRLQTLIAEENACLISIIHLVRSEAEEKLPLIRGTIDEYMIAQLEVDRLEQSAETRTKFEKMMSAIDVVIAHSKAGTIDIAKTLEEEQTKLVALNQEHTLAAHSNLTPTHWGILLVLATVLSITVLALRDGSLLMSFIVISILLGAQGVLVVLRDVDNNRYLERKLAFKNPQQVFQALHIAPFYPSFSLLAQRTPDQEGNYRTRNKLGEFIVVPAG